ncbi:MAG: hypothetical protein A3F92_10215 [Candidatus Rokubacteria bacterium RIFCSPLOWO2_12_FULL_71_22]|nr:MAG: hypothetical protein A3F92_10215 [Candidatus Rokubacteria bacterium RIFCSPLOWO2_12_FULL_71_22]
MRLRAVLGAALALAAAVGAFAWLTLTPTATLGRGPRTVEVPAQLGLLAIASHLADSEIIRSPLGFVVLALVRGSGGRLRAGEYEIARGATTPAVLALLESGRVKQHLLLHAEGATVAELARELARGGLASPAEIERFARDPELLRSLGVEAPSLEGYLFPDTYQMVRGMRPEEILARMVQRLRAKLAPDLLARAAARGLTLHQLLTFASIVEREAVVPDEQRLISAVFWNRLRLGMPLQADPTVQYAVGKERRALTRADLQADSPYNTYRHAGLPPGPIASPGLAALEAVLDPAPVKYLYFVAKDDRRHHFSSTVEQHNAAVARWRRLAGTR